MYDREVTRVTVRVLGILACLFSLFETRRDSRWSRNDIQRSSLTVKLAAPLQKGPVEAKNLLRTMRTIDLSLVRSLPNDYHRKFNRVAYK
jgi:hypothetical protein